MYSVGLGGGYPVGTNVDLYVTTLATITVGEDVLTARSRMECHVQPVYADFTLTDCVTIADCITCLVA